MNKTENFDLIKISLDDSADITALNDNWDKIDKNLSDLTENSQIEDTTYTGCYYRVVDAVKEWINPPMLEGTEYRTNKRYMGKPVYVQCGSIGALPNTNTTTFTIGNSTDVVEHIVDLEIECTKVSGENVGRKNFMPFITEAGEVRGLVALTGKRTFTIKTLSDLSTYNACYYIEYTKV